MTKDAVEAIQRIIRKEIRFLRHYYGSVIAPEVKLGVGVYTCTIADLGWFDPVPVWPRFPGTTVTLDPGDVVDIGFFEGDENRPVWYGKCGEFQISPPVPKSAVMGEDLLGAFITLVTIFNSHIHPVTSAPGVTGPTATPQTAPGSEILSKKAKVL